MEEEVSVVLVVEVEVHFKVFIPVPDREIYVSVGITVCISTVLDGEAITAEKITFNTLAIVSMPIVNFSYRAAISNSVILVSEVLQGRACKVEAAETEIVNEIVIARNLEHGRNVQVIA